MAGKTKIVYCSDCGNRMTGRRKVSEPGPFRCAPCRGHAAIRARILFESECVWCLVTITTDKPAQLYCSPLCANRSRKKYGKVTCPCGTSFVADHDRKVYCQKSCARVFGERKPRKIKEPTVHKWCSTLPWSWCAWCDAPFVNRKGALHCSLKCQRQTHRARGRCKSKFEVTAARDDRGITLNGCQQCKCLFDASRTPNAKWCPECRDRANAWRDEMRYKGNPVTIAYLAERDGWVCRIPVCGKPITVRHHMVGNQWAPSRDHIVPVSVALELGWSWEQIHDPANQRLAHNGCNGRRGARGDSEQLALVG